MSITKVDNLSLWMTERRKQLQALTPEARSYKRIRGKARTPEEKKALVLACANAWKELISSGKLIKTKKGYILCKL